MPYQELASSPAFREPNVLAGSGMLYTMRYYFGIYHWQRRFGRLFRAIAAIVTGVLIWRFAENAFVRLAGVVLVIGGLHRARRPLRSILDPPPWVVRETKYTELATSLTVPEDGRLLDLGCGTGRSLVGLAPGLPSGIDAIGLDVFDDRVILGNGPRLAARNARAAGVDPTILTGDAARLPFADDAMDAITACRVLHDLPREDAEAALAECRRVLSSDGCLGVLELRLTHDGEADPDTYWRDQLAAAGFTVESSGTSDDGYLRYTATPARPT